MNIHTIRSLDEPMVKIKKRWYHRVGSMFTLSAYELWIIIFSMLVSLCVIQFGHMPDVVQTMIDQDPLQQLINSKAQEIENYLQWDERFKTNNK